MLLAALVVAETRAWPNRFVAPGPRNRWLGLPLYHAAQLLFGLAITY